ncbi:MAG: HK97 family phage prohead protease [Actinomycetes bacterium]
MQHEYEIRTIPAGELRVLMLDGKPIVSGTAIVFNEWSVDLGGFRERVLPGAPELDADLKALFDHNTAYVIGSMRAGTMDVTVDAAGVSMSASPPDTTWAADMMTSMKRGDIDGMSFAMWVREDNWYVEAGHVCRDIIRAEVSELTITSMPAYPQTTAEARSKAMQVRDKVFTNTLTESDQERLASWGRMYQLESALERTISDALGEGDTPAALAAVADFSTAAAAWVQDHVTQSAIDAAEWGGMAMYSRLRAARSRIGLELRAGRVLSEANEQALTDAIELIEHGVQNIETVLGQVDPKWADDEDEDESRSKSNTIPEGEAPSGVGGEAPSEEPEKVFLPGIGIRTFKRKE